MGLSREDLDVIDAHIDARIRDIRVDRTDLNRLEAALARLVEGQISLEAAVARLTDGQAKLEAAVARLTDGQAKLEAAVARLTDGQASLEAAVARLTDGQASLEAAVARLTDGQAKLFEGLEAMRREVAALSQNVGFGLEELAATFLPAFLEKHDRLRVSALGRTFLPEGSPNPEEVDLIGTARRNGDVYSVVVECRARVHAREVQASLAKLERLGPHLPHPPYPVMVAYVVHPSAQRVTDAIRFVSSHQL